MTDTLRLFGGTMMRCGKRPVYLQFLLPIIALVLALASFAPAQQFDARLYSGMQWRLIGPFRAGRVTAVAGIAGDVSTYYMGTPGGGVWKTTDGGVVWKPIFDEAHVASIGALALAPSDPNIIYVATGEQTDGNGVYKSTDAGKSWTNVGLRDTKILSSIIMDPKDPNLVFVGALGDQMPGDARGVFRTTNGGKNWERVLFKDDTMGIADIALDPTNHKVLYAAMWRPEQGFFGSDTDKKKEGPDAAIYKSTDQGKTWKQLSGGQLPGDRMGRIGLAVAPGNKGRRVFAIMDQGLFRSDDAGQSWQRITTDPRVIGNWYFARVFTDPKNADIVYVMQTALYRSTDGGKTFTAFRGAPGGDDYHHMWIDPENPQRIVLGVDQGASISVDGGKSFTPWYNQATGQFYHVTTDDRFPYVAYAEQQDSGTVAVPSRSDYGRISYRDWFSVGGFEFGYIAPDPEDANTVYATGWFGTIVRYEKTTGQINFAFVPGEKYRSFAPPMQFSPRDRQTLYMGTQFVMKTADHGVTWKEISPDLTIKAEKAGEGKKGGGEDDEFEGDADQAAAGKGMITALSLSTVQDGEIWVGTGNGLVHMTQDAGADWKNVTPAGLPEKTQVLMIETSHHDPDTAYMAVKVKKDDHPYFYRTHDAGKNWQLIANGLPDSMFARVVREDPERKGMLYAGTENAVYVSFDDGDHWNSLQLNLPTASMRDLAIHDNDLVVATFGRALWVLDDLSPLRQFGPEVTGSEAYLFHPRNAVRWRWDNNQETPLPPEVPTGDNPPDGAILDYYLKAAPSAEVTLTIHDAQGNLVRTYSSKAEPTNDDLPKNVPDYWLAPAPVLPANMGLNRFVWDLRYPDPPALRYGYYGEKLPYQEFTLTDHAVPGKTPHQIPQGPLVVPGQYEAVLNVGGKTYRQTFTVGMDPRVKVSQADLSAHLDLQRKLTQAMAETYEKYNEVTGIKKTVVERQKTLLQNTAAKDVGDALKAFAKDLDSFETGTDQAPGFGTLNRELTRLVTMVEEGDALPSASIMAASQENLGSLEKVRAQWQRVKAERLPSVNSLLQKVQQEGLGSGAGH
jgi:photosystem II stability/assembly factor-like uncharacterized protein